MQQTTDRCGPDRKSGLAVLMARLVDGAGMKLEPATVRSIVYSLYVLDVERNDAQRPVAGHDGIALNVRDVIFNKLQIGEYWAIDDVGFNFRHRISLSNASESFHRRGARYEIRYEITQTTEEKTIVCFRVRMVSP